MLSNDSLTKLSHAFCGDDYNLYEYKSGPNLVSFFNYYFGLKDTYYRGFPSRWIYVYDNLVKLQNTNSLDKFFNIILSKKFLLRENELDDISLANKTKQILEQFNLFFRVDLCFLKKEQDGKYKLVKESEDLILIGSGGFANVFLQKSTGLVIKKLKDDFLTDQAIVSRFKREFEITKSLQDEDGIIHIHTFDAIDCSYSMDKAEMTLSDYLSHNTNISIQIRCVRQILHIMERVHSKGIIHRDLSPNNIFINKGQLLIADFGLGKDLSVFTSHQTVRTNALGQYFYCAPEQFMLLRDGDKRSDVYSLGRIINYIFTGDAANCKHPFRSVVEIATNEESSYRYEDAGKLAIAFEHAVDNFNKSQSEAVYDSMLLNGMDINDELEQYLFTLTGDNICRKINSNFNYVHPIMRFMKRKASNKKYMLHAINDNYKEICRQYEEYDAYLPIIKSVILDSFYNYADKEIALSMLEYIAIDRNRYCAQDLIRQLYRMNLETGILDKLRSFLGVFH